MSWQASGYVKQLTISQTGQKITRSEKLILLLLADYSHPDTGIAHPSINTLATEGLLSARQVVRLLASLERKKFVIVEHNENRIGNKYKIVGMVTKCHRSEKFNGDILKAGTVTFPPKNDDILSGNGDIAMSHEPRTYKATKDQTGEQPLSEDFPSVSFANKVAEELCLLDPGMNRVIAGAIDWLVKCDGKTKNSAVTFLIATGRDAQESGEKMRFWFQDRGWRKSNGNGKHKTEQQSRDETNAAVAAGVAKFLRGKNAMGNQHVSTSTSSDSGDAS